jgi:hypothetical protein
MDQKLFVEFCRGDESRNHRTGKGLLVVQPSKQQQYACDL